MAKITFKEYSQGQGVLFPPTIESMIPLDSPVRLVNHIVDELDLCQINFGYKGGGNSSYHPRMLLKVLFYAYLNNVYSCRKIESQLEQNLHYIWLSGNQHPNFRTINNFRSLRLKDSIHKLFVQLVYMLVDMGYITLKEVYVDGTKIEAKSNRYSFVWRKSVEKNKAKLEARIRGILSQINEGIAQDNEGDNEPPTPINSKELRERIAAINRENRTKEDEKQIKQLEEKHLPKLEEYENHLETLSERNSYSKTDQDATFMRMKEDHMQNGQLKPAYNVQIGTENQFITHFGFFHNPTDTRTLKPFLSTWQSYYGKILKKVTADSGYGSEENYDFLEANQVQAFVKYNYFHKEQTRSFRNDLSKAENLYYNQKLDYFVCPMGQHMTPWRTFIKTNDYGYESQITVYRAQNCTDCPVRGACYKAKEDQREIEVNHNLRRHKQIARENLTSEEGLMHRSRRPVEVEADFGQIKNNKHYNRFRHFSKSKVEMDFAILAIAFNIRKMFSTRARPAQKAANTSKIALNLLDINCAKDYIRNQTSNKQILIETNIVMAA
jgi:transposase